MSFPRYPTYKDSGVAWLGKVPEGWRINRIKHVAALSMGQSPPSDQCNSDGIGVPFLQGCADFGQVHPMANQYCDIASKVADAGDLLFSVRAPVGRLNIADRDYGIGRGLCSIRPRAGCNLRFLYYWLSNATCALEAVATGSTYQAVSVDQVANTLVLTPDLDDQAAIAIFLDRETSKIDALIAEQQRLIELLQEKRQAVISHAVTKGLNPDAPMKDSGVEWLGEVPEHWEVRPLKSEIFFQEGPGIMAVDFVDEGVPLLRVACVQGEKVTLDGCNYLDPRKVASKWSHFAVREGDLLLSGSASLGGVSEVDQTTEGAIPYTGLIRIRPLSKNITRDFIRLLIESSVFSIQIGRLKAGATIQHFGPTHLNQMKITLPPKDEQEVIAKELRLRKTAYQGLIGKAIQAVSLLQERRSALISAAVTGQIDVRGLVPEASAT